MTGGAYEVGVYYRWLLWLVTIVLRDRDFVVVNMDETGVSKTLTSKRGHVVSPAYQQRFNMIASPRSKDYTDNVTALLGVVCDNPELQPHLPQVILPKYQDGKNPPQHVQEHYEDMGYPIVALHGTTGWNTTQTMKDFLKRLRSAVQAYKRSLWILLVLDNCPAHVCRELLLYCKSLGIILLLIPPSLTWLLQMLDVHIFAELKRRLRARTTSARLHAPSGQLAIGEWIDVLGACVHEVLVETDWSSSFAKCGFSADLSIIREPIRRYIAQVDRTPRPPTRDELHEVLTNSTRGPRAADYHYLLLDLPLRLHRSPPDTLPPRAAALENIPPDMPAAQPLAWTWAPNALRQLRDQGAPRPAADQLEDIPYAAPAIAEEFHLPRPVRTGPGAGTRSQTRVPAHAPATSSSSQHASGAVRPGT